MFYKLGDTLPFILYDSQTHQAVNNGWLSFVSSKRVPKFRVSATVWYGQFRPTLEQEGIIRYNQITLSEFITQCLHYGFEVRFTEPYNSYNMPSELCV